MEKLLIVNLLFISGFVLLLLLGQRCISLLLGEVEADQLAPDPLLGAHGRHDSPRWWRSLNQTSGYLKILAETAEKESQKENHVYVDVKITLLENGKKNIKIKTSTMV